MALNIPLDAIGGDRQVVGVYATTSRRRVTILTPGHDPILADGFVQVARQGNPLFNEGLVAIEDKDLYSRTSPTRDNELFRKYAENPELAGADQRARLQGERRPDDQPNGHRRASSSPT